MEPLGKFLSMKPGLPDLSAEALMQVFGLGFSGASWRYGFMV